MKNPSVRATAAKLLAKLIKQNGSLASALNTQALSNDQERPLLQELCFGTCRWYYQLDAILELLISKPLKSKDADIHCLLLIGLYQIHYMRVPDYAVVNESVAAVQSFGKQWAKGLVNGVLRRFIRESADLLASLEGDVAKRTAHPQWLVGKLRKAWPDVYEDILAANNQRPPMTLRINTLKTTRDEYLSALADCDIEAFPGVLAPSCIYLNKACSVENLPQFEQGFVSVQDEASQLIPSILQLSRGLRVLDACAAPGGKTCHIIESEPSLSGVVAIDEDDRRLDKLRENLGRLELHADIVAADASDIDAWWDQQGFDRILLDAPCSATGIIRRHPDIKILRQADDVKKLCEIQFELLNSVWQTLKPDGLLLYSTCSVLPEENSKMIARFLSQSSDAKHEEIQAQWGVECEFGRQLHPSNGGSDGFFYALLRKTAAS
ncbi:MAG: 16S rRNA (cytosine(967)-C(5))-methyltransferase RsmB [Pseudohongiellaceae bacterium]|nr:16S rRNA (cytosine(967)-C(5))-methyltransferase RsmB [Pseudohongiellaceae bacterium]